MTLCPVCLAEVGAPGMPRLASHLAEAAAKSDAGHVRWLNQNVSRRRSEPVEIVEKLEQLFGLGDRDLSAWVRARFIAKFFGDPPHPFVAALQHPSRETLLGYAIEHQHFLRQWVRSCALIIVRTDREEVIQYELDNLTTEFGSNPPIGLSHYELLIRMGESLGVPRAKILGTPPLPATLASIQGWQRICAEGHWLDAMLAMHSLELIAHRDLVSEGASVHYFDPEILTQSAVTEATKAFLREGYEADVGHAELALALATRFSKELGRTQEAQATFLRSADLFDDYLIARLERGERIAELG
jgi:pyrroloquinoline-quinone synthase